MKKAKYMSEYILSRYHERRAYWLEVLGGRCVVCGSEENLEFDHIEASEKEFDIGKILSTHSRTKIEYEMTKCQLLCSEHHLEKSLRDGDIKNVNHGDGLTGKRNCYCDLCKPLKAQYNRSKGYRSKKKPKEKKPYVCGERRTYLHGCKCDECKLANTEYSRSLKNK